MFNKDHIKDLAPLLECMTDVAGVIGSIFALSLCLLLCNPQMTNVMLLSGGWDLRQTTYNQQDSRLISKHWETALI